MKQQHHKDRKALFVKRDLFLKRLTSHDLRLTSNSGFTFVELMIAVLIGMIIISATYATYISQHRSFTAQDLIAEMNTTSKIALDMIANDIREAGFGVPQGATYNINGFTKVITATSSAAAPDSFTIIAGFRRAGNLSVPVDSGSAKLKITGAGAVSAGDYISIAGTSLGLVTGITGSDVTILSGIDKSFPAGAPVYLIEDRTYQVVGMELRRGSDVIAENIEDFQIAYGYDMNDNGTIETAEFYDTPPAVDRRLQRIRVNVLARTSREDPDFLGQGRPPNMIENRDHSAAPNDSYKRRWWQMEVNLRNPL